MAHKHRKFVIETDGDDPGGESAAFMPDGHWLLQGRFWLAGVVSMLIAGASIALWINNTFLSKDEFYRVMAKHEGTAVARAEDLQRHEALPSHPAMFAMFSDLRVQIQELRSELAYLRRDLLGEESNLQSKRK
jgi:hypothetical protein